MFFNCLREEFTDKNVISLNNTYSERKEYVSPRKLGIVLERNI